MSEYPTRIGEHEVSVKDDELFVRFVGSYSPAEARQVLGLVERLLDEQGRLFFLMDVADSETPGPETRRVLSSEFPRHTRLYTISANATLLARTVMRLIDAAQRMAGRRTGPRFCFDSVDAARAFIAEERRKLRAAS